MCKATLQRCKPFVSKPLHYIFTFAILFSLHFIIFVEFLSIIFVEFIRNIVLTILIPNSIIVNSIFYYLNLVLMMQDILFNTEE